MRVIFMGTPHYAQAILEGLIKDPSIEVVAVFTQPDKPVGRKKVMTFPETKVTALEHDIKVFQPNSLKKEDYSEVIRDLRPDFIVVAAFGQILPKTILEIAPCINLHASILPAYRGASPIQEALLDGVSKTGVTAMLMDEGMDTGSILTIEHFEIPETMVAGELFTALTLVAAEMTPKVLKEFAQFQPTVQLERDATYCKKITKEEGNVSFDDAKKLINRYRGYTPWPGIFLESGLKLKEIELDRSTGEFSKGAILSIEKDAITVGCRQGSIRIRRVQPVGKNEMDIKSYINGKRIGVGDTLL